MLRLAPRKRPAPPLRYRHLSALCPTVETVAFGVLIVVFTRANVVLLSALAPLGLPSFVIFFT